MTKVDIEDLLPSVDGTLSRGADAFGVTHWKNDIHLHHPHTYMHDFTSFCFVPLLSFAIHGSKCYTCSFDCVNLFRLFFCFYFPLLLPGSFLFDAQVLTPMKQRRFHWLIASFLSQRTTLMAICVFILLRCLLHTLNTDFLAPTPHTHPISHTNKPTRPLPSLPSLSLYPTLTGDG
jgi:hypothetical protein